MKERERSEGGGGSRAVSERVGGGGEGARERDPEGAVRETEEGGRDRGVGDEGENKQRLF